MLDKLTSQQFSNAQGQSFQVAKEGAVLTEFALVKIDEHPEYKMSDAGRTPFSLLFKALNEEIPLDDGCYSLTGADSELSAVFVSRIVPPGDSEPGAYYQVVFS